MSVIAINAGNFRHSGNRLRGTWFRAFLFKEGELHEESVSKKFLRTASDGKNYNTKHYNLDMIISLGYRVNSKIATHFRQWATKRLNEYIRKGFTMDDERLRNLGGGGYWMELFDLKIMLISYIRK